MKIKQNRNTERKKKKERKKECKKGDEGVKKIKIEIIKERN